MNLRIAKKWLMSNKLNNGHWKYIRKHRPTYYDEKRKCWVMPSAHDLPMIVAARKRINKWHKNLKLTK